MKQLSAYQFVLGQLVQIDLEFKLVDGAYSDPETITLKIKQPDGTVQEFDEADLTQVATGRYRMFYTIEAERRHYLRCESTGTPQTADEYEFNVAESFFDD